MTKSYEYGVFIGRFQPLHNAHLAVIHQALDECNELILIIGSANSTQDIKNPFSYDERVEMISACLKPEELKRVHFVGVRDYFYNENIWITDVQQKVGEITENSSSIALFGAYKDASSYYISLFPQWDFIPSTNRSILNATDIRAALFEAPLVSTSWEDRRVSWYANVPIPIRDWINSKLIGQGGLSERFTKLQSEYSYIQQYRDEWAETPYPVTFVTTDAVVIKSGHVLVVTRKFAPGAGLMALPGGFIKQDETIEDAMLRELKEETRIKVDKLELRRSIIDSRVFDYPGRDLRGRTITHAFHIDLGLGELPEVKGGDDAGHAKWLPLVDALRSESRFYSDHWHIIYNFMQNRRVK